MRLFTLEHFITWTVNTLAVLVAAWIVPGITYGHSYVTLVLAALALGILNTLLRPLLVLLAFPLLVVTAGLFYFFINAFLLLIVGTFIPNFHVANFGSALLGALVISFVTTVVNFLIGKKRIVMKIPDEPDEDDTDERPQRRRIGDNDDDDDGPVIDV
ncbi:MAG: phage holin family protein [Verrucomicrobia bacterium]|nr:phage holin family protein [Verrucomicrobiota bacterium]MBR5605773.1 phage holin family protein [Verrucomicrobiota bacterium]